MHDNDQPICGTTLRVEWLRRYAVEQLQPAKASEVAIRSALCRYLKQGLGAGLTTGELVDWLGVTSPSLLSQAGYDDAHVARAMDILASITDREIAESRIGPEPYLP